MPLDPGIRSVLDLIEEAGYPPMHEGTPQAARDGLRALTVGLRTPDQEVPVGAVEALEVAGLPARLYRPEGGGPFPTLVYLHGGGWVIGDLDTHDPICRALCRDAEAVVVSVEYRLAPEATFPAAHDDALTAVRWAAEHLADLGGGDVLGVAGDSAGANLAVHASLTLPDLVDAQLLVYPPTHVLGEFSSREENGLGYFLETPTMEWFLEQFVPTGTDLDDIRLSPLLASPEVLARSPRTVLVTAELDPLRDEGEAFAAALSDAGVQVDAVRYDGMIHGFLDMTAASPAAAAAVDDLVARTRAALHP